MKQVHMNLEDIYLQEIASGRKKVEIRLNDEKRQKLNIKDKISFTSLTNKNQSVIVQIKALNTFKNLEDLLAHHHLSDFGNIWKNKHEAKKAIKFYSSEQIDEHGLLAITIQVI